MRRDARVSLREYNPAVVQLGADCQERAFHVVQSEASAC